MQSLPPAASRQVVPSGQPCPSGQATRRQKPPLQRCEVPQTASLLQLRSTQAPLVGWQRRPLGQSASALQDSLQVPKLH